MMSNIRFDRLCQAIEKKVEVGNNENKTYPPEKRLAVAYELVAEANQLSIEEVKSRLGEK